MPSIRNHKGRFSRTKSVKKITKLILDRVQQKHKNNNRVSDHSYATFCNPVTPTENITASTLTDDDLTYIPPDLVPLSHCRLVTELDTLANQLKSCRECTIPLHLHDAKGVRCYGLTGIVYIICKASSCQTLNRIKLGKVHFGREKKGVGIFYVNLKAATGMIHAGIGETQLNNFLSSLNVHCIDAKTLKIRENEAGSVLENQAIMSQQRHLQMEILNSTTEDQTDSTSGICISTDTCWQKKGSGRSYNSLSGVSTLIGKTTGKVVNHKVRISSCRICERAKGRGILPRQHKCRKNWSGWQRSDLEKLFIQKMVPQSKKLSNLGSSQANESFNNLIALKAPKTKHFSTSASFKLQSQLSVLQKNEGYNYISELNTSIGLSPGNETLSRGNKLNKKREGNKNISKSKQGKKQRKFLKKKRLQKTTVAEVKEGRTYHSSIGLEDFATIDIEEIPAIPEAETFTNIDDAPIVCFDLETTGLSRYSDITQIAACTKDSSFSRYIFPDQQISREASEITKITVVGQKMYYKGNAVDYKHKHEGMTDFLTYLSNFTDKPVLVGHNIKRFDCHVLFHTLKSMNMYSELCANELAFSPSYPQLYQMQLTNLKTFEKLVQSKCLSKAMALKTAKSNLGLQHFQLAAQRNNMAGIKALMTEKSSTWVVRVTSNKQIIQRVYEYLFSHK
ncbi:unnamed protein product [Mytilus coruscus]|uniref:Uncharacterized protein n=1 Tax=Mytilus coruscus TaxID=42192 RepID=A0A6J8CAN9_MYTCO|nr:unnamed protein product [Mytilus coruscus]